MIVGIDLGTSTSEVAVFKHDKPMLIRDIKGATHGILPSVVGVSENNELRVGTYAANMQLLYPERVVAEVKRLMGTSTKVSMAGKEYTPQEISAMILTHLRDEASRFLGTPVLEAVITVPAYFNSVQCKATREAAELAKLKVRRLVKEPTAAALAYGIRQIDHDERVLVYDLGGGTLDVSLLEMSEGVISVLASTGNTQLGGKDFDERLMQFLRDECLKQTRVDLFQNSKHRNQLRVRARRAKEDLSDVDPAPVTLPNIGITREGVPIDFDYELSRATFERLIRDLVESSRQPMEDALKAKHMTPAMIDTILLVGGSTRIPMVRQFVEQFFGKTAHAAQLDVDEAVAIGAAIASSLDRAVESDPGKETKEERPAEEEPMRDPPIVVVGVAPFTLGVACVRRIDGKDVVDCFDPLIHKHTKLPVRKRQRYFTRTKNQQEIEVSVYEGDAPMCGDNTFVGRFYLRGLPPLPASSPIEIEFGYNRKEELEIKASIPDTHVALTVTMQPGAGNLSDDDRARAEENLKWLQGRRDESEIATDLGGR